MDAAAALGAAPTPGRGSRGAAGVGGGSPGGAAQRGGTAAAEPGGDARARGGALQGHLPHPRGLRRHRPHQSQRLSQVAGRAWAVLDGEHGALQYRGGLQEGVQGVYGVPPKRQCPERRNTSCNAVVKAIT